MSGNNQSDRLLARALAEAMNRELAAVPAGARLKEMHTFSAATDQMIRRLDTGAAPYKKSAAHRGSVRRLAGLAAAFVCVIGLALVLRQNGGIKMGANGAAESADMAAPEFAADDAADAADGDALDETDSGQLSCAPDWQEQLMAESAQADVYLDWSLSEVCEDAAFTTDTTLREQPKSGAVRFSSVYEVYYEQQPDTWTMVYHTSAREMSQLHAAGDSQGECCDPRELGMTRAGNYRLVRQVNHLRQVLQITVRAH